MRGRLKYIPPKDSECTIIHDIYGMPILVYFPKGDKISPKNCEIGIQTAQLGYKPKKYANPPSNKIRASSLLDRATPEVAQEKA